MKVVFFINQHLWDALCSCFQKKCKIKKHFTDYSIKRNFTAVVHPTFYGSTIWGDNSKTSNTWGAKNTKQMWQKRANKCVCPLAHWIYVSTLYFVLFLASPDIFHMMSSLILIFCLSFIMLVHGLHWAFKCCNLLTLSRHFWHPERHFDFLKDVSGTRIYCFCGLFDNCKIFNQTKNLLFWCWLLFD